MVGADEDKYGSPYMVARLAIERGVGVIKGTKMNKEDKEYLLYAMGVLRGLIEGLKKDID